MKRKKVFITVLIVLIVGLCLNVFIQQKFIKTYTYTELEYRGYTAQDVSEIKIKHSYLNRLLSYNEWRISVEFEKEPNILFWFTYRDNKIIFQGVSSEPMLDKESILDYSKRFKNGTLLENIDTENLSSGELTNPNEKSPSNVIPGGTSASKVLDIAVSYANWGDFSRIHNIPLNISKMAISSVIHLPIYKFDTLSELEQFKTDVNGILSFDQSYDEVPSFNYVTMKYDEEFFDENTLMLVYVEASSGSCRFGVDSISQTDGNFCIHIKQTNNPEIHTDDMAGWFITVAVPDSMIAEFISFDADLNNTID